MDTPVTTILAPVAPSHSPAIAREGGGVLVVLTTRRAARAAFEVAAHAVASHCTVVLRRGRTNIQIAMGSAAFGCACVGLLPTPEETDAMTLGRFAFARDLVAPLAIEWRVTSGSLVAETRRELMSRDYGAIVIAVPGHALGRMHGRLLAAKLERWAPVDVVWNRRGRRGEKGCGHARWLMQHTHPLTLQTQLEPIRTVNAKSEVATRVSPV